MPKRESEDFRAAWPPLGGGERHYLNNHSLYLRGWPGNRTRPGRSGLDPLDNEFEFAHMQGRFIRALFSRTLQTDEPVYIALMVIVIAICLLFVALPVLELVLGGHLSPFVWCYAAFPGVLGTFLVPNLIKIVSRR